LIAVEGVPRTATDIGGTDDFLKMIEADVIARPSDCITGATWTIQAAPGTEAG